MKKIMKKVRRRGIKKGMKRLTDSHQHEREPAETT
jgi:hypothetical protein